MPYGEDESIRRNRNRSWWKQRTNMERRGVIILIIALLIMISLIIAIAVVSRKNKKSEKESMCLSQGCVEAAAEVLTKIDQSIDPCEDFYEYACGGFRKLIEIPEDKAEVTSFTTLNDVVKKQLKDMFEEPIKSNDLNTFTLPKKVYKLCMNTSAIEKENLTTIKQFFKDVGGWPILEGSNWNEDFDWIRLMQKLNKLGAFTDCFITLGQGIDPENSTRRIITIDQPELIVNKQNLLEGFSDEVVDAYYKYIVDLAVFFGVTRSIAEAEVRDMINFEMELAKISLSSEERIDAVALNNIMTIDELQQKFPNLNWLEYMNSMIGNSDQNIKNTSETVNVLAPEYIGNVLNLLTTASKRNQANYALFQILYLKVSYLPDYVRNRYTEFTSVISGTTVREPRWSECVDAASGLSIAVSALYARNYFHEEARQSAKEMISDVRAAFIDIVKKIDWMDDTTRKIAIEKALAITNHIGYPDEYLDDQKLEEYYKDLKLNTNSYLQAMDEIDMFNYNQGLLSFRDAINKTDWRTRLATITVNAQYLPQENSIELPAGILQGTFFNKDRPHYMNYGAIAYIIGHEITHGFDDLGKKFDKEGNVADWWANKTNEAFSDKAKCIVDQYSAIKVPEAKMHIKGKLTESENIADNGGIKEAYLAYETWVSRNSEEAPLPGLNLTAKQLFWVSAAHCWCSKERVASLQADISGEEHAPNRYRVMVPFANTDYFAKDFNCPVGSKMNPNEKCKVW